jgi:hypothetical protein
MKPSETAPGVKVLRQLWNVDGKENKVREDVQNISSDIYAMPSKVRKVPKRNKPI